MGKKDRLHPAAGWMALCRRRHRALLPLGAMLCIGVLAACAASAPPLAPTAARAFADPRLEAECQRLIRERKQERLRDYLHIRDHDSRRFDAR
jgi:hypothetical protein